MDDWVDWVATLLNLEQKEKYEASIRSAVGRVVHTVKEQKPREIDNKIAIRRNATPDSSSF